MDTDNNTANWQVVGCLARARQWESQLKAWVVLQDEVPAATTPDVGAQSLAGVGFGVKDIIDVAGFPTRFGSRVFADAAAAQVTAPVVAALVNAGAICIGKTKSTEFALVDPTDCQNPFDENRTPGGSSSGSGAVVGARVVPFALGSQTAGSLCRPAAYCGAYAYKATLDWWPMQGIASLARSFDMVGPIAVSVWWLQCVHDIWANAFDRPVGALTHEESARPLDIGVLHSPDQSPSASVSAAISEAAERFSAAGHRVETVTTNLSFDSLGANHRQVMLSEAAADILPLLGEHRSQIGPKLAEGLTIGESISADDYQRCLQSLKPARQQFWSAVEGFDVLLTPPVADVAPMGLESTGDPSFQSPWTALGGPLVNLPCGNDDSGMPLGIMLAAAPGNDVALLRAAATLDLLLPATTPASGSAA